MNERETLPPTIPDGSNVPSSPPTVSHQGFPPQPPFAGHGQALPPVSSPPPNAGSQHRTPPVWAWATIAALALTTVTFAGLYFTRDRDAAAAPSNRVPVTTRTTDVESTDPASESPAQNQPVAAPLPPANSESNPANVERAGEWFHTGTYQLPGDLPPGLYRVGTEWQKYNDVDELVGSSYANDGTTLLLIPESAEQGSVTLAGGAWLVDKTQPVDALQYLDGMYLVGVDIQPGTYRVTGVKNVANVAYAARLDENLVVIDNVVEVDSESDNVVTIEILPTDFAFEFTGRIEKVN